MNDLLYNKATVLQVKQTKSAFINCLYKLVITDSSYLISLTFPNFFFHKHFSETYLNI